MKLLDRTLLVVLALLSLWWISASILGPHLETSDGCGWDGINYVNRALWCVRDGNRGVNLLRGLPSLVVGATLRITGRSEIGDAVSGFVVLNGMALVWAIVECWLAVRALGGSRGNALLGVACVAVNFASLAWAEFYRPQIDLITMAVAVFAIRAWAVSSRRLSVLASALALGVNPLLFLVSLGLLFLPRGKGVAQKSEPATSLVAWWVAALTALTTACVVALFGQSVTASVSLTSPLVAVISITSWCFFFALLFRPFAPYLAPIRRQVVAVTVGTGLFAIIAIALLLTGIVSTETVLKLKPFLYLSSWFYGGVAVPLRSFIAHGIWFGPLFFCLLLDWRRAVEAAWGYGFAAAGVLALFAVLMIDPESRQLTFLWAMVAVVWSSSLAPARNSFGGAVFLLQLAGAQLWWIWTPGISTVAGINPLGPEEQGFFGNNGPWMTVSGTAERALWLLPLALATTWCLWKAFARLPAPPGLNSSATSKQ